MSQTWDLKVADGLLEHVVPLVDADCQLRDLVEFVVPVGPDSRASKLRLGAPYPLVFVGGGGEQYLWVREAVDKQVGPHTVFCADHRVDSKSSSDSIPWLGRLGFH